MDYVSALNRNLPRDIRVLAWSPVSPDFSARFMCCKRSYEYYFPESGLDIKVVDDMLDLSKTPAKPHYHLAADFPLLFIAGTYPESCLNWETSKGTIPNSSLINHHLDEISPEAKFISTLELSNKKTVIKKLSTRHVELTVDEKIENLRKKRKIDTCILEKPIETEFTEQCT
ncbi:uncharacterized protein DC041_0002031 [Schistosoma bovis]|uniref:Uncharacterized protein n=1 Tax=Schistosoma bovis TaxID=6184 RepID=A0A430QK63_SCHBO|nr:uncharacterized protein DC041_0002031 [Schistosoma bovis]